MNLIESLSGILAILAALAALTVVETLIPLRTRGRWNRRHLGPNVALTLITLIGSALLNIPFLLGLLWLQSVGFGLFNLLDLPAPMEILGAVVALDLAWYVTHRSMHRFGWMWAFHAVHHSDPPVDVTTTIRQHPGEMMIRYVYLAAFAAAAGVSPAGFALYRVWSALHGQLEHANIRLPQRLDAALTVLVSSPNMHKVHHSRDARFTDSNYGNILAIWDRLFGTFTPSAHGLGVDYGLHGHDTEARQTARGLLASPFRALTARSTDVVSDRLQV